MFTETELREMLRHSADRAPADTEAPTGTEPSDPSGRSESVVVGPRTGRHPRRVIVPIAVAASIVALIAGAVALVHDQRPDAARPTSPAAASITQSPAPSSSPTASARAGLDVPVVDEVRIDTPDNSSNSVGTGINGQQVIRSEIDNDHEASLLIAPAAAFDDRDVPRTHPVTIAGTTGYYAVLQLFPLSAGGHGGSAPTGTIVFRTPDQHWAFAWLQQGTDGGDLGGTPVNDPQAIIDGFTGLHATFAPGTARTPLQVGYLPADATFTNADLNTVGSELIVASITAQTGDQQIEISVLNDKYARGYTGPGASDDRTTCMPTPQECTVSLHRQLPGGFELTVDGTNYSAAETRKVLDNITVVADPNDVSTYPLLTDAIG